MRRSESVDLCLLRYTREGEVALAPLLEALALEQVIVPISFSTPHEAESGSQAVETFKVPTFATGKATLLPIFTSPERFSAWSSGRYDSLDVLGADLQAVVPANTWVMINPGDDLTVKLEPKHIAALSEVTEPERREAIDAGPPTPSPLLLRDLATLLIRYPEVEEAFCYVEVTQDAEGALGLLAPRLNPSRRFSLVGEIAEVSRQHFGTAGAIEVFDDLHIKTSRSWELFSSLTPFYHREDIQEYAEPAAELQRPLEPLREQVEVDRENSTPPDRSLFFSRKRSFLGRLFG